MSAPDRPLHDPELVTIRTIARVAQVLIDLRAEYERRPNDATVAQIRQRIRDLDELEGRLGAGEAPVGAFN